MQHLPSASFVPKQRTLRLSVLPLGAWLVLLLAIVGIFPVHAQDSTDTLNVGPNLYYFSGMMVYTPASGGAPVRLRMGMGFGFLGEVRARTERIASGQEPFRVWEGSAQPEPKQGTLAEKFYLHSGGTKYPQAGDDPDHFHQVFAVPDGLAVTGLLSPTFGSLSGVPNLSLGQLNLRLQAHRVTGGGIDPDGSTYAFTLLEQTREPVADPGVPVVFPPYQSDGYRGMGGTLTITHPDGRIEQMKAEGSVDENTEAISIAVPTLIVAANQPARFQGRTTRSESLTTGGQMAFGVPFAAEANGYIRPIDQAKSLLPGIKQIGVAFRYGRLIGGCVADDGTAYSFVLTN